VTKPRTGFPFLDDPIEEGGVVAMAHRGGACHPELLGYENTLFAFEAAVALGYRYLETDVHATSDGVLLAFHDTHLDRVTDQDGRIWDLGFRDISALVGGREPIPRLEDLVEALPEARFNIDLKSAGAVEPLAELVARMGLHDRICVGSFSERRLRRFRALVGDRVATTRGVATVAVERFLPFGRRLGSLVRDPGPVYQVPVHHRGLAIVDRPFVDWVHSAGRHVHVWTVDERAEMEHLLDLGVDGLITDRTDVCKEVLVERGLWGRT